MDKKVVLVTGATSDIGFNISKRFAMENYVVVIHYLNNENRAEELKQKIEEEYNMPVLLTCFDISKEMEVEKKIKEIIDNVGKIDVLINCAAIEINNDFFDKRVEDFRRVLDVNLIGTFITSREVSKYMLKEKCGSIINISSNNAINKYNPYTLEYDISKAGINLLTKELAKEFAPFIRVNTVILGWVLNDKNTKLDKELDNKFISSESENILLNRFANCNEVANITYFLANDEASYINSAEIIVDGGTSE